MSAGIAETQGHVSPAGSRLRLGSALAIAKAVLSLGAAVRILPIQQNKDLL